MSTARSVALTALLSSTCLPALAQAEAQPSQRPMEEMVITSSRWPQVPISETTRSVTVITAEDLVVQQALNRSAGAILAQKVPGFSPSTEALTNFGQQLRGRNFQTLIDGIPQDTPLRNGQRSLQSIDIDAIERIEVVRGGTAIYGFGADGGLINYITKRPTEGAFALSGRAGVEVSTNQLDDSVTWNTNLTASGRLDSIDYLLSGTFVRRGNTFDADGNRRPTDPVGAQGGLDESDEFNLLAKLGFQPTANQRLEASFNIFSLKQDPDFGIRSSELDGTLFNPPSEIELGLPGQSQDAEPGNESVNVNLLYEAADILGSAVRLQGYYQQIDTVFTLFPGFPQTEIESEKFGTRLTVNTPIKVAPITATLSWGIDYLADETGQFEIDGPSDAVGDQDAIAGFAQLDLPVGPWGLITAGIRHEAVSIDVTEVMPSGEISGSETLFNVSASAFLTEQITLFGGFNQSFSPGDILRVITDGTFTAIEDVELEFVRTDTVELGLRAQYDRWQAELVGFYSESDNGTSFDEDLNILTQPEQIYGLEASASVRPTDRWEIGGTVAWIQGEVDLDDDGEFDEDLPTTRIPPEKVTAFVAFQPVERVNLRAQLLYSGRQDNKSSAFGGGQRIDDYILLDLYGALAVGPGVVDVGVTNLLDNAYFPVINQAFNAQFANVQGPGRRVSLAYRFRY